jgi:hypothetical protein
MLVCAFLWLGTVMWLCASNAIAREIPLVGAIAQILDRFPEGLRDPIYVLLWLTFLVGWAVPLIQSVRSILSRSSRISN